MCPPSNDSGDRPYAAAAHQWLDENLVAGKGPRLGTSEAIELVESQSVSFQVAILKACVERLPVLREQWSNRNVYALGEQLYAITSRLYGKDLPVDEVGVCDILRLSKHGCGHGIDVQAPVDLAVSCMLRNDVTSQLLLALATYVDGLKGIGSVQAQNGRRKASIVFLLDRSSSLARRTGNIWSHPFTDDLNGMDDTERRAWQSLVLSFKLNDRSELPKTWSSIAQSFTARVGEARVVSRIAGWWPKQGAVCKLDAGASHLLKHFVWLLEAVDDASSVKPTCHELVTALAGVRWKPLPPAAKVVCAAAHYLVKLPTEMAWEPLRTLCTVASTREKAVRELATQYAATHNIDFEAREPVEADHSPANEPGKPWWKLW